MRSLAVILVSVTPAVILYVVIAWRVRRVTYLSDGTRITWFPLLPGVWSEEGEEVTTSLPWEDQAERTERIAAHLERARRMGRSLRRYERRRVVRLAERAPVLQRAKTFAERVSESAESALR